MEPKSTEHGERQYSQCSPNALGIAIGIVWAIYVFFLGITALFDWGGALVEAISTLYIGYGPTFGGALIGALYGFIDGYIAGFLIAWLYNKFI